MEIKQAEFITSMAAYGNFAGKGLKQIAVAGKSNVGKSSLINKLCNRNIHIAHEEGFSVMAHCNGPRTMEAAAEACVDSIEHGAYADSDALCAMAENKTVWVPTVSTVANLRGKGRFNENAVAAILESTTENIRKFAALGGILAPGSDAGAWAVPHGADTEHGLLGQILGENADAILDIGTKAVMERF